MNSQFKNIVILGGGTAGWMTAAALSSMLDPKDVSITVVESDQIATVGVGEATIPDILNFNHLLGIQEETFMKATNATFKLGIQFVDWYRKGHTYVHPFGAHGVDMNGIDFHNYWMHDRAHGNDRPIEDYNICAQASKVNHFALPDPNPKSVRSHLRYAYHFDATLYARFLRNYAEERGVTRIEGKVVEVKQAPETGYLTGLRLEGDKIIEGDLFFDCSGFSSLLLTKTLGIGFNDWSHWLPCDSAHAVACENAGPLVPYTRSTAQLSGWPWRTPTQHRIGCGHVYSSEYMSDDEAASVLVRNLDGAMIGSPRQLRFKAGHRQTFWSKNCVGIGLAAGFLEPLESTSIYFIQEGISRFISLYPEANIPDIVRDEYNRHMCTEFEQVRDFIILHYAATERDDSPFWNYCRHMSLPDSLTYKMTLFSEVGRIFRYEEELFAKTNWVAVFLGQGIIPKTYDPIVRNLPPEAVRDSLESMRQGMMAEAGRMVSHADSVKNYCPAPPL
ncbi:MAG: tryptophan halogenase family protein [Asticcacaulis sp.]